MIMAAKTSKPRVSPRVPKTRKASNNRQKKQPGKAVNEHLFLGLSGNTIKELIKASPNIFLLVDQSGYFRFANRLASKLFPVITDNQRRLSDNLPEVKIANIRDCIKKNKKFEFIIERNHRSYHFFARQLKKSAMAGLFGIEITDLSRIEADLVKSQSILRKVLDTDPNMIFVKDMEGRFVLVNEAVADTYGTTVENLIGKSDADFNPKSEEIKAYVKADQEVILSGKEKIIDEESVTDAKGNTRYFATVKRPLRFGPDSETYVLGVSNDITSMLKLQETLHQATKMEALGQLAGGVAHDFNNLLTAIMGHAEIIRVSNQNDPVTAKSVDMIGIAADRAKLLTEQLLGFARKGKREDCAFDLHVLIKDTLDLLKRTIEPSITLGTKFSAEDHYVSGDPSQIQQVIMNLCINARDALLAKNGKEQPKLEIRTRNLQPEMNQARLIQLIVSDNGCGMEASVKERAFEPFFTTKEVGRGTGLGLSTVYGIVCNHGGKVDIETKINKGSRFFVTLPVCKETSDSFVKHQKNGPFLAGGDTVLLVDDHQDVLLAVSQMLQTLGLQVKSCNSGLIAIGELSLEPNQVKLAIVDMVMPDIGGAETIREIKKIRPDLPVLVITGFSNDKISQRLIAQGIPFLRKPFGLEALKRSISMALMSGTKGQKESRV